MALEGIVSEEDRTVGGKVLDWVAPFRYIKLNRHFDEVREYDAVDRIFKLYKNNPEAQKALEHRLLYHLKEVRKENRRLKLVAGFSDTIDKTLLFAKKIPALGYLARIPSAAIEWPVKAVGSKYYSKKTGEKVLLKDMLYEGFTELPIADWLDALNRYSVRVDKYASKTAAERFEDEVRNKGIVFPDEDQKKGFLNLVKNARDEELIRRSAPSET